MTIKSTDWNILKMSWILEITKTVLRPAVISEHGSHPVDDLITTHMEIQSSDR